MHIEKSFSGKNWKLAKFDRRKSLLISQRYQLNEMISLLITIRGIEIEDIPLYLEPNIKKILPDPFILKDMEKSVIRLSNSIINKEKIGIISDYDVDGSTSAALLIKFFKSINIEFCIGIPDRINEGYGPNKRIINYFKENNVNLIISLDCGTSSFDVFNKDILGTINVIVIDHHIGENQIPHVFGLINPNRKDEDNNLKNLAAVGVTFLFLVAIRRELRSRKYYISNNLKEHNLTSYLDLVALGTACDVVPLTNLNRAYVSKGLEIMHKRENKGLSSLVNITNIKHAPNVFDLSFILGPRLNAASRIGDSILSSKILSSNNLMEIESIARKLQLLNEKRKLIEDKILIEAIEQVYKQSDKKIIIAHSFNWHPGVLGIVASRILEEFQKPVIVISKNDNEGIGSARSLPNIDLGSLIIAAKEEGIILKGGGHRVAAGLKIKNNMINTFSDFLEKNIDLNYGIIIKPLNIFDSVISLEQINNDFINGLELLEPYGNGNKEPRFLIQNLNLNFIKIIKDKHISMSFTNNLGHSINGICFNVINTILGDYIMNNKNETLNIIATIKRNNFSKNAVAQLIINDVAYSE